MRKVIGGRAFVQEDGKWVEASGTRCALQPVGEYLPAFIEARNIEARTSYLATETGMEINHSFYFRATFESALALDDVFLVLDLDTEQSGKVLFWHEIGRLEPHKPRPISLDLRLAAKIGETRYKLHLFAGGVEVFHSGQPLQYRESKLDEMVAKRVTGVQDADPKPFVCPPPEYPTDLAKKDAKGRAEVSIRIMPDGAVVDPVLASATDPAFGEAALAAVRQWRFIPAVKAGRAVERSAKIPFDFTPYVTDCGQSAPALRVRHLPGRQCRQYLDLLTGSHPRFTIGGPGEKAWWAPP